MARARHVCNGTLGISRAPTAYALFCAHAKANWKTPARRRIKHKSSFLTKGALQKKWETLPEDEQKKFKQYATQRAARNKLLRESAEREKRVASCEERIHVNSRGLGLSKGSRTIGALRREFWRAVTTLSQTRTYVRAPVPRPPSPVPRAPVFLGSPSRS